MPDLKEAARQEKNILLKQHAIVALGMLGEPRAEALLLDIATKHEDPNIRYVAAEALSTAGTPEAIARLQERLGFEPFAGVKGAILGAIRKLSEGVAMRQIPR